MQMAIILTNKNKFYKKCDILIIIKSDISCAPIGTQAEEDNKDDERNKGNSPSPLNNNFTFNKLELVYIRVLLKFHYIKILLLRFLM